MKIAWLANVQPPYREPMWKEVAAVADLEVSFFLREEKVRHFRWRASPDYRSSVVRSLRIPLPRSVARLFDEPVSVLGPGVTKRMLRGVDALVIHVWWQPANFLSALRARMLRIPYIVYAESTLQSRRFAKGPAAMLRSAVFGNAGAVIVPGPAAAEAAVLNGTPSWRVVESVNSVDLDRFYRAVRELRTGRAEEAEHRFLCIGQLIERKNVGSVIRALSQMVGDATLDIAGDGVQLDMLRSLALTEGVGSRVRFHGHLGQPAVLDLLSRSHTLVLPSTEEVYGYTALEAHVAGLQVVVSDRAGIATSLTGRPGTWVVEPTVTSLCVALDEARRTWTGWRDPGDIDFASPRRAARDILRAVEVARTPNRSHTRPRRAPEDRFRLRSSDPSVRRTRRKSRTRPSQPDEEETAVRVVVGPGDLPQ